jgi:hypothetical protein
VTLSCQHCDNTFAGRPREGVEVGPLDEVVEHHISPDGVVDRETTYYCDLRCAAAEVNG